MAGLIDVVDQAPPQSFPEAGPSSRVWPRLGLPGVMLVSLFMNFYQLGLNGFGNLYYAAAIRSMIDNWHNFFFVSYDPGGFVTVDKPPLGFWLQALSSQLFGFTPFSVYLPQALAGVLSVLLLYWLVRRHFGVVAGLLAALALALSPISVVTNRNNTIDSTLALALLLGAWAVLRAAETGKLRWLLLCAAIVGIGFNIKMAEAYLVLPAFGLLYLVAAPRKSWTRIGHLSLALLLLLAVSLSWLVAVDLTPASQRPYVGSTQNNSELSLAFGYNGINRLVRSGRGGDFNRRDVQQRTGGATRQPTRSANNNQSPQNANPPATQRPPQAGANRDFPANAAALGGFMGSGQPGPFRLFSPSMGGQVAWLLPFAILGMIALAWQRRPRFPLDHRQISLVLWGMLLLTMGIFFSVASFSHQYYMTEMAPAVAALFGIGAVVMGRDYRAAGWRGWLLPLALLLTMGAQIYILSSYPAWAKWLDPLMAVPGVLAVIALVVVRLLPRVNSAMGSMRSVLPALCIGILVLLIAPAVWAAIPVLNNYESQAPMAGPISEGRGFAGGRFGGDSAPSALVRYLESNQGNTKFLVATTNSMSADSIILATNKPVMAMGGFMGADPILTVNQLAALVKNGTVRYFLLPANESGNLPAQFLDQIPEQYRDALERAASNFGGFNQQAALTNWVKQNCATVPASHWQSSTNDSSNTTRAGLGGSDQLYDCASAR